MPELTDIDKLTAHCEDYPEEGAALIAKHSPAAAACLAASVYAQMQGNDRSMFLDALFELPGVDEEVA